jgi:dienelactone hydrolase
MNATLLSAIRDSYPRTARQARDWRLQAAGRGVRARLDRAGQARLIGPMRTYDPFARGPFPVGVRTTESLDASRDRLLPIETWYPAADKHAGEDVDPSRQDTYEIVPGLARIPQDAVRDGEARPGRYPLVCFSHGYGGHRRQSTFLCTHLASHGYVVAAVDHTGNTMLDVMQAMFLQQAGEPVSEVGHVVRQFIEARPADVDFLIERVLAGEAGDVAELVDSERIGMTGHSFGGWTTLAVTRRNPRVRAALPLAPAGGENPLGVDALRDALDFEWGRDVPTLFLVAEYDSLLPLPGMHELLQRTRGTKGMIVLKNADHMHFCDRVEEVHEMFRMLPPPGGFERVAPNVRPIAELLPGPGAHLFIRGLGLAHLDRVLKGNEAAAAFLEADVAATLAGRGIPVEVV